MSYLGYWSFTRRLEDCVPSIDKVDFKGKKVAYFGAGDQFVYPDTFLDALGILEEKITNLWWYYLRYDKI